jgi:fumarate reductase flavoprotein subunit
VEEEQVTVPVADNPNDPSLAEDIAPVEAPETWTHESDVVIVGGGGAGLCAAAAALHNGARVLVLERQATTGGHSQHGGAAASFNTAAARRKRLHAKREAAFRHTYAIQSNGSMDARLLAMLIDRAHEVYDWSETQSWGKRWNAMSLGFIPDQGVARMIVKGTLPDGPFTAGTQLVAQMYPWMEWLAGHVTDLGGTVLRSTTVKALVKEGGAIIGVEASDADGNTIFARADKGVILAGSGFSNNRAMIKKYCPDVYTKAVGTFVPPSDTGEVVRMAFGAGADVAGRDSWTAFAGGIPFFDTEYTGTSQPGPWYQYLRQGWLQVTRGNGWLEVNHECEEFLPDAAHADYELHPKAIAAQHGSASYVVFDADFPTTIWQTLPPPMLDDRPMTPDDPEYPWFDRFQSFMPKDWLDSVHRAIELGGIKQDDTIEGLAAQLKLDPEALAGAVSAWNAKAAAGKPDEFGRLPQNMKPIRTPPYYGIKTGPLIAGIFCGPRVNHRLEVLDTNRRPIPGLFAAGLTAGGTNGEGVFNATVLSNLGLAFSTGWIAGDNATAPRPTYTPGGMILESEVWQQQLLNELSRRFPRVGAAALEAGFQLISLRRKMAQRVSEHRHET